MRGCKNSGYIPISFINNGIADCPLNDDERFYPKRETILPLVAEVPKSERCIYDRNRSQNGTAHCLFYKCPYHFKCSNTFCIPHKHVCDNVTDCPEGDDEIQSFCNNVTCHHMFRCVYGAHCLHPDKVCDGFKDCSDDTYDGEDEAVCGADKCHPDCYCNGHVLSCTHTNLTSMPTSSSKTLVVFFKGNFVSLHVNTFSFGHSVLFLVLSENRISVIPLNIFTTLTHLRMLDISQNSIWQLQAFLFRGMGNLTTLLLQDNPVRKVERKSFSGLKKIKYLNLANQELVILSECAFIDIPSLLFLNLSGNKIDMLSTDIICDGTNKARVDLTENPLEKVHFHHIFKLNSQVDLLFSHSKFCCYKQSDKNCQSMTNSTMSFCRKILDSNVLKVIAWVVGIWITVANVLVILWRFHDLHKKESSMIIQNLSVADSMIGISLLIIGYADHLLGLEYILWSEMWFRNSACKLAGALAIISLGSSPHFMLMMLIYLYIVTKQTVRHQSRKKIVSLIVMISWVIILSGAVFFAHHSTIVDPTCLYFRLAVKHLKGWEITLGLLLVFDFIVYSVVSGLFFNTIRVMQEQRQAAHRTITSDEISLIARQACVTATCFVSWIVIASVCLHTMLSEHVDQRIIGWILSQVLSLNAISNPILYTFATITFRNQFKRLCHKFYQKETMKDKWLANYSVLENLTPLKLP